MERDLFVYLHQCMEMCDKVGVPYRTITKVEKNSRAKRWGICKTADGGKTFQIEISSALVEAETDKGLINTMLHEILHTCEGCMNHGKTWKMYADKIYNAYGIVIKTTSSAAEKGVDASVDINNAKYRVVCSNCGNVTPYYRACDVTENPAKYTCRCGCGNLVVYKDNKLYTPKIAHYQIRKGDLLVFDCGVVSEYHAKLRFRRLKEIPNLRLEVV